MKASDKPVEASILDERNQLDLDIKQIYLSQRVIDGTFYEQV